LRQRSRSPGDSELVCTGWRAVHLARAASHDCSGDQQQRQGHQSRVTTELWNTARQLHRIGANQQRCEPQKRQQPLQRSGAVGGSIGTAGGISLLAVVVIVKVVVTAFVPGVTEVGLNTAVVRFGKPVTAKLLTAFAKPLADGVTVIVIIACCPALTVVAVEGALTV